MIYKITYGSMTAFYELGYCQADSQEDAERIARARNTAFSGSEKTLIKARAIGESEKKNITLDKVY